MADSLRDQLIAAGFDAPKEKKKKVAAKKKRHANPSHKHGQGHNQKNNKSPNKKGSGYKDQGQKNTSVKSRNAKKNSPDQHQESAEAILERKQLKAQIKTLIDDNKLQDWKGEVAYRYLVEKRIRELYVNEPAHKKLADREAAITRLNGDTYLVPSETAAEILKINPKWSVFNTEQDATPTADSDGEYSEFKVPDDLQW